MSVSTSCCKALVLPVILVAASTIAWCPAIPKWKPARRTGPGRRLHRGDIVQGPAGNGSGIRAGHVSGVIHHQERSPVLGSLLEGSTVHSPAARPSVRPASLHS